jgi:general secretion pathway protein J
MTMIISKFEFRNSKPQNGFTLIEITIAITLLALMAVILYGSFYLGERAVGKAQERSEQNQRMRTVEDFLGGYIRSAYPYRISARDPTVYFSGDETHLEFVSSLSAGLGGRGMSKVTISWELTGDRAGMLTLEEEMPVRVGGLGSGGGYRNGLVLGEGVRDFRIGYLDSQSEGERWVELWDGRERKALPRAVRLSYHGERGGEIRWLFPIMMNVLTP